MLRLLKRSVGVTLDNALWRPGSLALVRDHFVDRRRHARAGVSDLDHIRAAAQWIARAQDAATDGGVMGRYRLRGGWTSSYPETTGYLIPTMLVLSKELSDASWRDRAKRAVDFLLRLQLPNGAFPAGEVHENTTNPSVFNSAQILSGLRAWHAESNDEQTLSAATRCARWLCEVQDDDGAWRKHIYLNRVTTYTAHASCWLAEFGDYSGQQQYVRAAERHLDWVLSHRRPDTGWIDRCGFDPDRDDAVTHTLAYTLWGVLLTSQLTRRSDGVAAVRHAADRLTRRLGVSGWLPGVIDANWRGRASYACLTGNCQLALLWLRLYHAENDPRFLNAALGALDEVKAAHPIDNPDPGIRGGIAGSAPVWGDYMPSAIPNWSAKFFVDAMFEARAAVARVPARAPTPLDVRTDIPGSVAVPTSSSQTEPQRVVLLASPYVHKVAQMLTVWRDWGFRPAGVVVERRPDPPAMTRVLARLRDDGVGPLLARVAGKRVAPQKSPVADAEAWNNDVLAVCAAERIPVLEVTSLASPEGVAALTSLRPDVAVHAGAGILRATTLAVPRLGTLNAHMGTLPAMRGMNVTEWAIFCKVPVGCTVHLIDAGIDTGDILCTNTVDISSARNLAAARLLVDRAQILLLGDVVRYVTTTGQLPPRHAQRPDEGRQFHPMHPVLRAAMDAEMSRA